MSTTLALPHRARTLDLTPTWVNLQLYAGDGATIRLAVTDSTGTPLPLNGIVEAQIRAARGATAALEAFAVDLAQAAAGVATLTLTGDQTTALLGAGGTFVGCWDVQWTPPGSEPISLVQGDVGCVQDVTRV